MGPIYNIIALVQTMAFRWPGVKPLSEPMMVSLLMHICIIRPQWVNYISSLKLVMDGCLKITRPLFVGSSVWSYNWLSLNGLIEHWSRINSSPPSAACMCQWIWSALVQRLVAYSAPSHYLNQCWVIPPFHWATIRSRSKSIWKMGPIGNKRELNGSDGILSDNERQRSGVVGKVECDLWTCSKIAPDLRGSGTGRRSSVRSVSWSSPIVRWSYELGTQRVLSGCRISSRSYQL